MKVLKFGGTSVGSIESIKNVKMIVEQCDENVIVVVSALGGITDKLIATANKASIGDESYTDSMQEIRARHSEVIAGVVPSQYRQEIECRVNEMLDELINIYRGVFLIKELSSKTLDAIVSYGERLSSTILSRVIEDIVLFDSRTFIKTETQFNKHIVDFDTTNRLITETFAQQPRRALVPGFISSDHISGDVTNLGRGGSDYTAAILAATLDATQLEIWTDVDGFMTADPRVISSAYVIEKLSFTEATELCNYGAKVIYPPTISPVYHKNIPIVIKNTFNPTAPGTLINNDNDPNSKAIKGISSINDTCLITVSGLGMVGVVGVNSRIFNSLAQSGVNVFMVSQASSENSTTFAVRNADAELAVEVLNKEFASEIEQGEMSPALAEHDLATIAIVGENMKSAPGIAGKLFGTLGRSGINTIACAQGAQKMNISIVIKSCDLRKTLNAIHDSFFLSSSQVLNLFVMGVGSVGSNLLKQIAKQQNNLLRNKALNLRVVGIANSHNCIFNRDGIDLNTYCEQLSNSKIISTPTTFKEEMLQMNMFNSVFVDCTDSGDVAAQYYDILSHNISVVASNKIAASSSYNNYIMLKETAKARDVKFLFETNVGAGLPIINTINALTNSGDSILHIDAALSGTLNYIFNTVSNEIPLSRAIKMAIEAGYSEPDPRVDLSGKDVLRKMVILAREAGYTIEQEDVDVDYFIPKEYFDNDLDTFMTLIPNLDADFEQMRMQYAQEGKLLRYVASLNDGHAKIGLQAVDSSHPLYQMEGSNNVILITTDRYHEYPMIIKGYGAGAGVTAAGVFADIISIANIR
ncbi:MAG: bifunctional aspartate kinase/homoserine dehydrogenase I [Bacteroidaceae bacterium]|nr:bifunctional aspartate kinase/homoserine dehydrogenase I [Bacteroidaceae bacterium]